MKSISKALNVLELLVNYEDGLALQDIAIALGMEKSTVCRIVAVLNARGFLKQRRKRGKYSLGIKILDLGESLRPAGGGGSSGIIYLDELSRILGETVAFVEWAGSSGLPSRVFEYSFPLKVTPVDWRQMPLNCTCMGKILLASMSAEELNKFLKSIPREKYTPNTIVDAAEIKHLVTVVRREGVAFDNEERNVGMSGIAACVKNKEGEIVGCIYVIGPSVRLSENVLKFIMPSIKNCALKISMELGYRP